MKALKLNFRSPLPNGEYFYQEEQYLISYLRRVLMFHGVSHQTYLKGSLEDLLEIQIDNEWVKCDVPKKKELL